MDEDMNELPSFEEKRWVVTIDGDTITVDDYEIDSVPRPGKVKRSTKRRVWTDKKGLASTRHSFFGDEGDTLPGKRYVLWAKDQLEAYSEAMRRVRGEGENPWLKGD